MLVMRDWYASVASATSDHEAALSVENWVYFYRGS
jgi:hypothetical protein